MNILSKINPFRRNNVRFLLFAHMRSGSSVLNKILNLHPDINSSNEGIQHKCINPKQIDNYDDVPFEILKVRDLKRALKIIAKHHNGIKLIFGHLDHEILKHVLLKSKIKVLYLSRRNMLQTAVSGHISKSTKIWFSTKQKWEKIIDNHKFDDFDMNHIRGTLKHLNNMKQYLNLLKDSNSPHMEIEFDDIYSPDISDALKIAKINSIFSFLGYKKITDPLLLIKIKDLLNPEKSKMNSPEVYKKIPNIYDIEKEFGSDENGWLFK